MDLNKITIRLAEIILGQVTIVDIAPNEKVELGEVVVGTLEDPVARSLYSLSMELRQYGEDYIEATKGESDTRKREQDAIHISTIADLINIVAGTFWRRVHELFPQTDVLAVTTAVRDGWQVVIWKSPESRRVETLSIDLGSFSLGEIIGRLSKK